MIQRYVMLFSFIWLCLGMNSLAFAQQGKSELLDARTFAQRLKTQPGILIDVRTPNEFKKGYIQGARLINIFDDAFETQINALDKSKTIYVYCAAGGRSAEAAEMLIKKGFKHVIDLDGGIGSWKRSALPVAMP